MYSIKSIYGSRYIKCINLLGSVLDSKGNYTTKHIILYAINEYISFSTEELAWEYLNIKQEDIIKGKYLLKTRYNELYEGSYYRVCNSISNLCVVKNQGLEYHGKNSLEDIEQFKWCKLRKYGYYR